MSPTICEYVLDFDPDTDAVPQLVGAARRKCDCGQYAPGHMRTVEVHGDNLHLVLQHRTPIRRMDSGPLCRAIRRAAAEAGVGLLTFLPDETDRRLFYRYEEQGWVNLYDADEWAVRLLDMTATEVYGAPALGGAA